MKTKSPPAALVLTRSVFLCALGLVSASARAQGGGFAQTIFNANFDAQPLGPLGTEPATDPMPLGLPDFIIRDDASCRADVVPSAGNLINKPLDIHGSALGLTSLEFANPTLIESGQWHVGFDWVALTANNDSEARQNQFDIAAFSEDDGYVVSFGLKFDTTGHYQVQDGLGFHQISTFTLGAADHIDLNFVPNGGYTLAINGAQRSSGPMLYQNFYSTVFDSNGRGIAFAPVEFAIDNLVVVPEPATTSLLLVGLVSFLRRWPRR
jgi:hypothetical protein